MGIDCNGARFLLDASRHGVVFERFAMLGRQEMHVTPQLLRRVLERFSLACGEGDAVTILDNDGSPGYAESFLRLCGAGHIVSFDNSDYEGATVVHDMNRPVPGEYEGVFDCVLDSGTLEHIFHFPVAAANCMRMVKPGGHFLAITPCNNFMGHGFYQFSPELFYGLLSERNGFVMERMFIYESRPDARWYRVSDPRLVGGRVELTNDVMTYLLIQARRTRLVDLSHVTPQQSDYLALWENGAPASHAPAAGGRPGPFAWFRGVLKSKVKKALRLLPVESLRNPFHRPWYEPYE